MGIWKQFTEAFTGVYESDHTDKSGMTIPPTSVASDTRTSRPTPAVPAGGLSYGTHESDRGATPGPIGTTPTPASDTPGSITPHTQAADDGRLLNDVLRRGGR
jgi:hypothetical protein